MDEWADGACTEYRALIVRAADDDDALDVAGRAALAAHLPECTACRQALAGQRAMRAALAALPRVRASADFQARVMTHLSRASWIGGWDFRRWTWRLVPVAALLALAVFGVARTSNRILTAPAADATVTDAGATAPDAPVLWSESMSDTSVLSLMLGANRSPR